MPFAANERARTAACSKERGLSLGGFHLGNRQECDLDYQADAFPENISNGVCLSFLQTGDSTGQNRNFQQHERT